MLSSKIKKLQNDEIDSFLKIFALSFLLLIDCDSMQFLQLSFRSQTFHITPYYTNMAKCGE